MQQLKNILIGIVAGFDRKVDLKVIQPESLKSVFLKSNNKIPNFLSPYGIIPWGKYLKGTLEVANPIDGCKKLEYDPNQVSTERPFLLIEVNQKDYCGIEERIYHAQNHGAQLVILILHEFGVTETWEKNRIKLELISIPVIQIDGDVGLSLINAVNDSLPDKKPTLMAIFPSKDTTANFLKIFADVNSLESYQLFTGIENYNQVHRDKYIINIHYHISETILDDFAEDDMSEKAKEDRKSIQVKQQKYCFGAGQYCERDNPTAIKEIIRQICLFKSSKKGFFKYVTFMNAQFSLFQSRQDHLMTFFKEAHFDFDEASKRAIQETDVKQENLNTCYNNSFIEVQDQNKQVKPLYQQDNYILKENHDSFQEQKIQSQLPVVILNNKEIFTQSKNYTQDVLKALCDIDNDTSSKVCSSIYQLKKNKSKGLNTSEIILIIMGSLAGAVLMCYGFARIYSRYQKRRYSFELERVDSLVQSYIELNAERDKQHNEE